MSRIKTIAALLLLTSALSAKAAGPEDLTETMAICAGRMSAELEFAWLLSDPAADQFENQRLRFVEILNALGPNEDPRQQLALRIDAKMAHAGLLTTAHFGTDAPRAAWAKRHAIRHRQNCQILLLDS
ncbi:MAG: hypothetical protein AAF382_02540 [Pseudomonadota bacterium]